MKDRIAIIVLMLVIVLAFSGSADASKRKPPVMPDPLENKALIEPLPSIFRLRILAHSERQEDQAAKLAIRDLVLTEFYPRLGDTTTYEEAVEQIRRHTGQLEYKIAAALGEKGVDYGVKMKIVQQEFPAASYGDLRLPAGQYRSLNITLGEGKGQNWWCVLYPPLCFMELNDGDTLTAMAEDKDRSIKKGSGPWLRKIEDWRQELKKIIIAQ